MISVTTLLDTDVLDAVRETARESRAAMRRELGKLARGSLANALLRELSREPGRPNYPLRWKSKRQRRYVMALLRETNNLPYRRTHRLAQGWRVVLDDLVEGAGVIRVENDSRIAPYVQGDFAQPYHLDTGWPQMAPLVSRYSAAFQDATIDAWLRINNVRNTR